jgi:hypothetical protein
MGNAGFAKSDEPLRHRFFFFVRIFSVRVPTVTIPPFIALGGFQSGIIPDDLLYTLSKRVVIGNAAESTEII